MDSFLFPLVTVFLASLGGRDQILVAQLSHGRGQPSQLLALAIAVSAVSAVAMAMAGSSIAAIMPAAARQMLVALALLFAALELFWPVSVKRASEPTRSLGAIGLVLLAWQIKDAARFAIFAFAAATVLAPMAALGGALGAAAALFIGWNMGDALERRLPLRIIRAVLGCGILIVAIHVGLSARGIL